MHERSCDIAVIGAGTAGLAAFRAAREAGADAVLIEAGPGGTTCARVGCMPSKLLITAADAADAARRSGRFGIETGPVRVDGPAVLARVREERDRFVAGVREGVARFPESAHIDGRARFDGAATLIVDARTRLSFRAAIVATGSRPVVPGTLRDLGDCVLTTDTLFEITDLPASWRCSAADRWGSNSPRPSPASASPSACSTPARTLPPCAMPASPSRRRASSAPR